MAWSALLAIIRVRRGRVLMWEHTASHYKVEQPLYTCAKGHICGTQTSSGNLTDENPDCRAPAELEKSRRNCQYRENDSDKISQDLRRPEVDASNGNISERGDLNPSVSLRRFHLR